MVTHALAPIVSVRRHAGTRSGRVVTPAVRTVRQSAAAGQRGKERRVAMGKNVGAVDRFLRVIVGAVLIALVFVGPRNSLGLDRPDPDRDGADRLVPRLPPARYPDLLSRKEFLTEFFAECAAVGGCGSRRRGRCASGIARPGVCDREGKRCDRRFGRRRLCCRRRPRERGWRSAAARGSAGSCQSSPARWEWCTAPPQTSPRP